MKRCFGSPVREWLHPERFRYEPIYCEAQHNPDDVVCIGSDDEAYDSPTERRIRCEEQARRFLEGKPVFLLSASLRGPFERESGWVNPWRSKSQSKSSRPRAKPAQRGRPPPQKQASTVQDESSHVIYSSSCRLPTPGTQQYLDGETFSRVWNWRDQVLAATNLPTSPARSTPDTDPNTADSRRATQQTVHRGSVVAQFTLNSGWSSSAPPETPLALKQKRGKPPAVSASEAQQFGSSVDQPCSRASAVRAAPSLGLRDTDGSPQAVRIYEEHVLSGRSSSQASHSQQTSGGGSTSKIPSIDAPSASAVTDEGRIGPEKTKTSSVAPAVSGAPSSLARLLARNPSSARTDGSFRYQRKATRETRPSLAPSKLSRLSHAGSEVEEPPVPAGQATREGDEAVEANGEDEGVTETTSQIDGPTLVPSTSFGSENPSMPSFGHFSYEQLSQDATTGLVGLPRKLLWPRSQQRADKNSLLQSPFGSDHPPDPPRQEPVDLSLSCSIPSQKGDSREENAVAELPRGEQPPATIPQNHQSTSDQNVGTATEVANERLAGKEMSEGGVEDGEDADQRQTVAAEAGSGGQDAAGAEMQPASSISQPKTQSPWAKADEALLLPQVSRRRSPGRIEHHESWDSPTSLRLTATQSPWTKQTDPVVGTPTQNPFTQINNPILSVARQALEPNASQSPWARGDSQIAVPVARPFNPLSSPANSSVLPAVSDNITQPDQPSRGGDDVDMCNSQPYQQPPSTPEAKHSGLPTPDFSLSVKSFKDFMTPSPQPAKRRRVSAITADGRLPSTQALLDAALANPWAETQTVRFKKPRKQKRVSWALPDEEEKGEDAPPVTPSVDGNPFASNAPSSTTTTTPTTTPPPPRTTTTSSSSRAASPPPSILSAAPLPGANEKFARHFAAVLGNRRDNPQRDAVRLLPSASQQTCGSPAVEAMAEAFLRADGEAPAAAAAAAAAAADADADAADADAAGGGGDGDGDVHMDVDVDGESRMQIDREGREEREDDALGQQQREHEAGGEDQPGEIVGVENCVGGCAEEVTQTTEDMQLDDVSAVMEHLDDFLGGWDLDADLARVRAEAEAERRERESGIGELGLGEGTSSLMEMDAGVWDQVGDLKVPFGC